VGRLLLLLSSSRRWRDRGKRRLAAASVVCACAAVLCIHHTHRYHHIYMCVCACVGLGAAGQRAAAHQWWASYKVRIAQSFIVITTTTTWWEGACLCLCVCVPRPAAALVVAASGGRARGTAARISTRPPLTAASQQDTPIHTHTRNNTPRPPLIGASWCELVRVVAVCACCLSSARNLYNNVAGYRDV